MRARLGQLWGFRKPLPVAPVVADVTIASQTFVVSGTGNKDLTIPGLGWTPKAVRFVVTTNTADGAWASALGFGLGATDGTSQWAHAIVSRSGVAGSDSGRRGINDGCILLIQTMSAHGGAVGHEANFVAWIADGVRLNFITNAGSGCTVTATFFGGVDLSAAAGVATVVTGGGAATVTPGFELKFGIFAGIVPGVSFYDTSTQDGWVEIGYGTYDGVTIRQSTAQIYDPNANPTTVQNFVKSLINSTGDLANISSTSFDINNAANDTREIGYLVFGMPSNDVWAGVLDSPTATGTYSVTAPGFEPICAEITGTLVQAIAVTETDADAGALSANIITVGDQHAHAIHIQDNTPTNNTGVRNEDLPLWLSNHIGTEVFRATGAAFTGVGVDLPMDTVDAATRKWPALFVGLAL